MTRGKQTCNILKEIRRQIAEANGIEFITSECRYKGDCRGTCPKCEAEVRYLEQQLRARTLAGKTVALAGISAGMILMSGCGGASSTQSKEPLKVEQKESVERIEEIDTIEESEQPVLEDSVVKKNNRYDDLLILMVGGIDDEEQEDTVYNSVVEVPPTFPGGDQKLMEWISQHIQYPESACDSLIQGQVVVKILVKEDGAIGDVQISESVSPELDNEALRVIKTLPEFTPATVDGRAVEYWLTIPVSFKLAD